MKYTIYASICLSLSLLLQAHTVNAKEKTPGKNVLIKASAKGAVVRKKKTRIQKISGRTSVKIPTGYRLQKPRSHSFKTDNFHISIHSRGFRQGDAVYIEIIPPGREDFPENYSVSASFDNKRIRLNRRAWGFRGLFAIAPWSKTGKRRLRIWGGSKKGRTDLTFPVSVKKADFRIYRRKMDLGRYSNRDYLKRKPGLVALIRLGTKLKKKAFSLTGPDLFSSNLSHPRDLHKITSPFYAKRVTDRYVVRKKRKVRLKPRVSRHGGVDLKGPWGEPIFALATGRAIIARKLYYEGNFILLDHGNRIFSAYMHMSRLKIREGQKIKAGQHIGDVGSTGMVTGPHLHLSLYMQGIKAAPLSLLSLPVRD